MNKSIIFLVLFGLIGVVFGQTCGSGDFDGYTCMLPNSTSPAPFCGPIYPKGTTFCVPYFDEIGYLDQAAELYYNTTGNYQDFLTDLDVTASAACSLYFKEILCFDVFSIANGPPCSATKKPLIQLPCYTACTTQATACGVSSAIISELCTELANDEYYAEQGVKNCFTPVSTRRMNIFSR